MNYTFGKIISLLLLYLILISCLAFSDISIFTIPAADVQSSSECISHSYSSCYSNDVYWFNSCNQTEEKKQECGPNSCSAWSSYFCMNNSVYKSRTCYNRGCANNSCFSISQLQYSQVSKCPTNSTSWSIPYCKNNDRYVNRTTFQGACLNSSCSTTKIIEEKVYQDCGPNSCSSWGSTYCKNNKTYQNRTCFNRGCANNSCFSISKFEEKLIKDCGNNLCQNGRCINQSPITNYVYDANGNMIQDDRFYYEYNSANKLSKVREWDLTGRIIEEYKYNYRGERIIKIQYLSSSNKNNITTFYPSKDYETEIDQNKKERNTSYFFANGERIASLNSTGAKNLYLSDHLGSSSVLVTDSGVLLDRLSYNPFGSLKSGGTETKYNYNSKELDDTGLLYYGARYYNPTLMRWTQPDWIIQDVYDPQNLNRYSYVKNNPLKYTDPTGNVPIETVADVASVVWDLGDIYNDPTNLWNYVALAGDVVTTAIPYVPPVIGMAVKGTKRLDQIKDLAKIANKVDDAVDGEKIIDKVGDAGKGLVKVNDEVRNGDNIVDALKAGETGTTSAKSGALARLPDLNSVEYTAHAKKGGLTKTDIDISIDRGIQIDYSASYKGKNVEYTSYYYSFNKNKGIYTVTTKTPDGGTKIITSHYFNPKTPVRDLLGWSPPR